MALNTLDIFMAIADKKIEGLPEGRKPIKKIQGLPVGRKLCKPYQNPDGGRFSAVVSYILPI